MPGLDIRKEYCLANRILVLLLVAIAAAPVVVNVTAPRGNGSLLFALPSCAVRRHTGRPCTGCGLTRSVLALYRGDFAGSRAWHPAGSLFVMLIFVQLLLRPIYLSDESAWLAWIDIGQAVLTGVLFGFCL